MTNMRGRLPGEPLAVFDALCDVSNALERIRDDQEVCSDLWVSLTYLAIHLDRAIDMMVRNTHDNFYEG